MNIDHSFHEKIRSLDVNEHKVSCDYKPWKKRSKGYEDMLGMLSAVENSLGESFGRAEIVQFYKGGEIDLDTKFLSAMIWGYEAPAGKRRDNRGPSRVVEMMKSVNRTNILDEVKIGTENEIVQSWKLLNKVINRCGSSFLTKHLYFLGKASGSTQYPLIMDDRVAIGLVKLFLKGTDCLELVSVHAQRKAKVYGNYLSFANQQASCIGCDLDKIEYFLFLHGSNPQSNQVAQHKQLI